MGIGSLGDLNLGFRFWRANSAINMLKANPEANLVRNPHKVLAKVCAEVSKSGGPSSTAMESHGLLP